MQFGGIGISNLPNQCSATNTTKQHQYNIMVAGASGLGKTTFLNNLLRKKVFVDSLFQNSREDGNREMMFFKDKREYEKDEYEIQENKVIYKSQEMKMDWFEEYKMTYEYTETEILEKGIKMKLNVIEIDRIGDSINNEDIDQPIVDFINKKYRDFYDSEKIKKRDEINDERIHICLYFIEPYNYSISEIDLKNIKEISKICNIIPIVGRSDMFTLEERSLIKETFDKIIKENKISLFKKYKKYPFFIVGNYIDEFGIIYERQYPWGAINANNKYMSDTENLKTLIIRDQLIEIKEESEIFYKMFRNVFLREEVISYLRNEGKLKIGDIGEFNEFLNEHFISEQVYEEESEPERVEGIEIDEELVEEGEKVEPEQVETQIVQKGENVVEQ